MTDAVGLIPRFFNELLAYFVPGAVTLIGVRAAASAGWRIVPFKSVADIVDYDSRIAIAGMILASYLMGRALYALADWTIKPLITHLFGDPDKYLLLKNTALLHKVSEDYKPSFKQLLRDRVTGVFGIDHDQLAEVPCFKLCSEWIEVKAPQQAQILGSRHTAEILSRNTAIGLLVISLSFVPSGRLVEILSALSGALLFTYYFYVRQIKRARSVYEMFFALTIAAPPD